MGVKKSGKGRRKLGRKIRRMRAKIRHRKLGLLRVAGHIILLARGISLL